MHGLSLLLVELGALLLGLSVVALAARALGLPAIPFFLLGGLAFGEGGLVSVEAAAPFVTVGAELGVLLLLLVLGLEFSAAEFTASLRRHHTTGIVDLLLNAPPGFVAGWVLDLPVAACLALAGVTWVSSSGIVARLLDDLGRLGNRETPAVLSVLVLEDIAMAVALPLLAVILSDSGVGAALVGVGLAVGVLAITFFAASRVGSQLGRVLSHPQDEQVMLRLVGLMLVVAGLTQGAGMSAAVGAFLVGLAIPPEMAARARSVLEPLRSLFAAIFFVAFGLTTDPGRLPPVMGVALSLAAVTLLTKVATGWYAASLDGVQRPGRLRAGTALVPRGEFSIVIAGLAAAAGHVEVAELAAAYVLILAVVGPLLARFSGQDARGRRSPGRPAAQRWSRGSTVRATSSGIGS